MEREDNRWRSQMLRQFGKFSIVGIQLVLSTIIGFGVGYWLDKQFHTQPWLSLAFLLFGICAGFLNLFRTIRTLK